MGASVSCIYVSAAIARLIRDLFRRLRINHRAAYMPHTRPFVLRYAQVFVREQTEILWGFYYKGSLCRARALISGYWLWTWPHIKNIVPPTYYAHSKIYAEYTMSFSAPWRRGIRLEIFTWTIESDDSWIQKPMVYTANCRGNTRGFKLLIMAADPGICWLKIEMNE